MDNQIHKRKRIPNKSLEKEFCKLMIKKKEKKRRKEKDQIEKENRNKLLNSLDLTHYSPKSLTAKKNSMKKRSLSIDKDHQLSDSYSTDYSTDSENDQISLNTSNPFESKNIILGQLQENDDDSASEGNSVVVDYNMPKNLNNHLGANNTNNTNFQNENNITQNFKYDNIQFFPSNQETNFNLAMIKKDMIPMLNFVSLAKIKENILSNWKDNNSIHSFFDNLMTEGKHFITIYHKGPSYLREQVFSNLPISFEKKEFFFMQICKLFSAYAFDFELSLPLPEGVVKFHLLYPELIYNIDRFVKVDQSNQFFFYNFIGKNLLHFMIKVKLNLLPQNKKLSVWNEF